MLTVRLNDHPCSFLDAHLNLVSKPCYDKPCYEEASIFFLLDIVPRYGIDDIYHTACSVCVFLCQCFGSAVFINFKPQNTLYNNLLIIVHFYNLKRITLFANIKMF